MTAQDHNILSDLLYAIQDFLAHIMVVDFIETRDDNPYARLYNTVVRLQQEMDGEV